MEIIKILGPPGTGKSYTLIDIMSKEIESGVDSKRIAFLTFTRAARLEALSRTGKTEEELPFLRTIHAICYRQLAIEPNRIVRPVDLRSFGRQIGIKLTGSILDPWVQEHERGYEAATRDDILLSINHCGRHRKIQLKESLMFASTNIDYKYAVWFTKAYRTWKNLESMLDYTDILSEYLQYGKPLNIDVALIDEAQDLSLLQWDVVNKLCSNAKKMIICGDDDQAIFHWAGADSEVFQNLSANRIEVLGQSYRVSKAVHTLASTISSRIKQRLPKIYLPRESDGEVAGVGYIRSIEFKDKTFILFRNHYRGQDLANQLLDEGIPFIGHGSPLHDQDIRSALFGWYQFAKNKEVDSIIARKVTKYVNPSYLKEDYRQVLNKRKIVKARHIFIAGVTMDGWYAAFNKIPSIRVIDLCVRRVGLAKTIKPNIELLSIHQSKGREADTVVLDTDMSQATWESSLSNPDDEHRVWYVGVTRAKERVFTLLPDGNLCYPI